jgi:integrase
MGAVIDLSQYQSHFQGTEDQELAALESYKPSFLAPGTEYPDLKWMIKDAPKDGKGISFSVPIAPNFLLSEDSALVESVKLALSIMGTSLVKTIGKVGPEGLIDNAAFVINFLRLLRYKYDIHALSSINDAVQQELINEFRYSLAQRLNVQVRLTEYLESITDPSKFEIQRSATKPDLKVALIAENLGVSDRLLSSEYPVLLTKFREKHGFYIKASQKKYLKQECDKKPKKRKKDTIRKELTAIKKFFRILEIFRDIIPEQHRPSVALSSFDPNKLAKKWGEDGGRTKNIPQPVFFEFMDRAIRWVVDYADPLLEYRDRAIEQQRAFFEGNNRGGSEESRWTYASGRMVWWFRDNPLTELENKPGAPYNIVAWDREPSNEGFSQRRTISPEQVEEMERLCSEGLNYQNIADELGVSKASVSRLLNQGWVPTEGYSLNKVLHRYLPTACLAVIYCFTARRQVEIESLQAGCCFDSKNGHWIKLYSAKVLQNYQVFPTIKLVQKAVHILERLTESIRSEDDQSLLRMPTFRGGEVNYWQDGQFNEFADLVMDTDEENKWVWSEHQFRRFFAMTYFFRWDAGDLPTLSHYLRHSGFQMTQQYLTDPDWRLAFDEVRAEKVAHLALHPEGLSNALQEDLSKLLSEGEVEDERRFKRLIKRVNEVGIVFNHVPDGLCFGESPAYKERSACFENGEVQRSSAVQGSCQGCANLCSFSRPQDPEIIIDAAHSAIMKKFLEKADA